MMAQKALLFADLDVFGKILQASDPKEIKALGRKVKGFDSEIWDIHKARIVVEGNIAKFGQNENIKANLIATGSKILVESSPKDKVWGIGLATADAVRMEPSDWSGENLLGFALMLIRETFD